MCLLKIQLTIISGGKVAVLIALVLPDKGVGIIASCLMSFGVFIHLFDQL